MFIPEMPKLFHKLTLSTTTTKRILGKDKIKFNAQWVLFLTLLVLFPANLAKHLFTPSAYIQGLLVDYLLPTAYLTEFLVSLLLGASVVDFLKNREKKPFNFKKLVPLSIILLLLPSLLTSGNFLLSGFRFAELCLWLGFALWVKENVVWERDRRLIIRFISFGVIWVSFVALLQYIKQKTAFGYWFLGEPIIYPSLGGVAKTFLFGKEVLRAYGTFPHPNVLGGVLAIFLCWILSEGFFLSAIFGLAALFVSFSRLAWVTFALGLWGLIFKKLKGPWRFEYLALSFTLLLVAVFFLFPSGTDLSLIRRTELLESAWAMFLSSPWLGVGLGRFSAKLPAFGVPSGPTLFLQPVHNIFALIASESGFLAFLGFLAAFALAVRNTLIKKRFLLLITLIQLVLLGFFDHYLYTLPQGLFLLCLVFGLVFSPFRKEVA